MRRIRWSTPRASAPRNVLLNTLGFSALLPDALRPALLRAFGMRVGDSRLYGATHIHGRRLAIGNRTFINQGCLLDCSAQITIEDDVLIGPRCVLTTTSHEIGGSERRCGPRVREPIGVGRGSWLGASVTVLGGVTIGAGCVIAAGSVVNRDCEPDGLYAGVPARRIRTLDGTRESGARFGRVRAGQPAHAEPSGEAGSA